MILDTTGGSVDAAIIGQQKVFDGVRLNCGRRLRPFEAEDGAVDPPSHGESDAKALVSMAEHLNNETFQASYTFPSAFPILFFTWFIINL